MVEKIKKLIEEWEKDGNYFDGPDDDPLDKAVGQAYKECAKQLKEIVSEQSNAGDAEPARSLENMLKNIPHHAKYY